MSMSTPDLCEHKELINDETCSNCGLVVNMQDVLFDTGKFT